MMASLGGGARPCPPAHETYSLWITVRGPDSRLPASPLPESPSTSCASPSSASSPFFPSRAVEDLAACLGTPRFLPHITLLGGGLQHLSLEQISSIIRGVVAGEAHTHSPCAVKQKTGTRPFYVRVQEVTSGPTPYQCIFARIRQPGEAPSPHASAVASQTGHAAQAGHDLHDDPESLFALNNALRVALYDAFGVPYKGDNDVYMPHVSLVYANQEDLSLQKRQAIAEFLNKTHRHPHESRKHAGSSRDLDLALLEKLEATREKFGKHVRGTFISVESIEIVETALADCSQAHKWKILESIPLHK
ncbi:hypothetical protein BESB_003840 [Besnoitia besnoiti]|uniref:Cyclic phosphodiesterase-like protein n=1 Tax=Besnoitia besnoiti TaxID=94643 RepID=A0A2A9MPN6_BESBE|nr:hypothetical protein BESB_003840 [Besnoitia besnoiti]PFH38043.1 hypothetical protein BESB_003840 [Besnoitia besnoiti]